jgi:hypothetical protein
LLTLLTPSGNSNQHDQVKSLNWSLAASINISNYFLVFSNREAKRGTAPIQELFLKNFFGTFSQKSFTSSYPQTAKIQRDSSVHQNFLILCLVTVAKIFASIASFFATPKEQATSPLLRMQVDNYNEGVGQKSVENDSPETKDDISNSQTKLAKTEPTSMIEDSSNFMGDGTAIEATTLETTQADNFAQEDDSHFVEVYFSALLNSKFRALRKMNLQK